MRLRHGIFLAPLLAGLLTLLSFAPASPAVAARPLVTGITVPDAGLTPQLGYDRIRNAGAKFTRVAIFWSRTVSGTKPASWDPTDPGDPNYDWTDADYQITSAIKAGLTPMVQIYSAPKWAERCVTKDFPGICNPDPVAFQRFTAAAVKRYSGNFEGLPKVRFWEPWNEPNLFLYFMPQRVGSKRPSPILYRELLNRFAGVVKKSDPTNMVVGGGLAPIGGDNSIGPLDFTRRLLCMQGRKNPKPIRGCKAQARFDIYAVNPYTTGGPTQTSISPDDVQLGDVGELVRLIRAARKYGKIKSPSRNVPVWITEFTWDSKPPDPGGLPMRILSRWAAEAMYRSWNVGVTAFFWLTLRDWHRDPYVPHYFTYESGLWFRGETIADDRPKEVLRAFRYPFVAFRKPRGIMIWGRTPTSRLGNVVVRFGQKYGRESRKIKVVRADKYGIFRAFISTRLGRNKRGFVRADFKGEKSLPFSLKPVKNFRQNPFGNG